ncbi:histone acetyltransferase [Halorhabdus sp. CBA1104]|uniref:histone acetyltransferase n=1 Tax=Halorhabdus sp. CBA1104 TaxID=1380432 RepID=UPI0012B1C825|nr:histone acetyltransferase [Halorhabdus sp. CBA1104]QGN06983.1 histone acetyltransferase [Halorhabdus sp. CBA1104]
MLNAPKVAAVTDRIEGAVFEPGPLPVYEFDGDWYLTDGHTRAFVAFLTGCDRISVVADEDLESEYDLSVYRACIEWCAQEGIERVPDLAGRVVGPETFQTEWIDRCQAIADG